VDSITQIALGAVIGQAIGGRKLGAKAMIFGGLAGFIPDLDVLVTPIMERMGHHDEFSRWKYHRHVTHSLWFGPVLGSLMGWGLWKWYEKQVGHLLPWIAVMILALLTHPLLDTCTIYGTQLLAPFSDHRYFISSVSIIDPFYSLPLIFSLILYRIKSTRFRSLQISRYILFLTTAYLAFGWGLNFRAESLAKGQLAEKHISYQRLDAYTTIFQPWLRRVVVWEPNEKLRVGFISTLSPSEIKWSCFQQSSSEIRQEILDTYEGRMMNWFSVDTLAVIPVDNGTVIRASDARYGTPGEALLGWWGVEFVRDENGALQYSGRNRAERDSSWHAIGQLFRAAYGLENGFLNSQDQGCL